MKWRKADLHTYFHSKEYIDSIVVPLVPFGIANDEESEKAAIQKKCHVRHAEMTLVHM